MTIVGSFQGNRRLKTVFLKIVPPNFFHVELNRKLLLCRFTRVDVSRDFALFIKYPERKNCRYSISRFPQARCLVEVE